MTLTRPFFHSLSYSLVLYCIALNCLEYSVYSQDYFFEKVYTNENGLAHNSILAIDQDTTGFLWLGTWDGLSRFDGYEFRNYYHDPNDPATIPTFSVQQLKVDRYNTLWILSLSDYLCRYIRSSDSFETIDLNKDTVLGKKHVDMICVNKEGELMTAGINGLTLYEHSSGKFAAIRLFNEEGVPLGDLAVISLYFDNSGYIWLTTSDSYIQGVFNRLSKTIRFIRKYPVFNFTQVIMPAGLSCSFRFEADMKGKYWFLSNWGCMKLSHTPAPFIGEFPEIFIFPPLKKGTWYNYTDKLMISTGNGGVSEIKLKTGEYPYYVFAGSDNSVWYSTITSSGSSTGLHRYQKTPSYFHHYFTEYEGKPVSVFSIAKDKDQNLLIGSRGNNFVARISPAGEFGKINVLSKEDEKKSSHPRAIMTDSSGIWIGYMNKRLDNYDYSSNTWTTYKTNPDPVNNNEPISFRVLNKISEDQFLIGSYGLFVFQKHTKPPYKKIWPQAPSLYSNIFCIVNDGKGITWVGASQQIVKLKNSEVDTVLSISDINYTVEDISVDEDGTLWLALLGGGIEHFDPVTGNREFFTTSDGLSNNTTYSIQKDNRGNLWISTDNGISRFNPRTRKFRTYGYSDGLRIHEFNSDASWQTPEGYIYFGGMGGVVGFFPDSTNEESVSIKNRLIITEFRVSGVPRYFKKAVYLADTVILAKGDNNFGITFGCIDYRTADRIKYRYRLIGQAKNWIHTSHLHRNINFAGLRPGDYILQIESADLSGIWNNRVNLTVIIPPRFYQTSWFLALLGIIIICILGFLLYLNNYRIRMKEKQKQQYLKLETVRGQMNPHFIFNSLNSINYFIAKSDRLSANRYIANFSKLIRSFLNNMNHDYVPFNEELATIQDYMTLEYLRFGDKFEFEIIENGIGKIEHLEVFPGMVQPFIENAIWHGVRGLHHKGLIRITFGFSDPSNLQCVITDNGIGRTLAEQYKHQNGQKSRGISLVRERMQIINHLENKKYKLEISDLYPEKKQCGTQVIIDIPFRNQEAFT